MEEGNLVNNKKQKCEECGELYRHVEKCKDGKFRCRKCKNKKPTNKWFIPKDKRINDRIDRLGITNQEKSLLVRQGHSWKEVNGVCKYMRKVSWSKRKQLWNKKKEEKNNKMNEKIKMKKLIEGLK